MKTKKINTYESCGRSPAPLSTADPAVFMYTQRKYRKNGFFRLQSTSYNVNMT